MPSPLVLELYVLAPLSYSRSILPVSGSLTTTGVISMVDQTHTNMAIRNVALGLDKMFCLLVAEAVVTISLENKPLRDKLDLGYNLITEVGFDFGMF